MLQIHRRERTDEVPPVVSQPLITKRINAGRKKVRNLMLIWEFGTSANAAVRAGVA